MSRHKFPYEWKISDGYPAKGIDYHGLKVFSCFSCGGGSSFGYKLAGYDVIGCNEIDPKMMAAYVANHNPKYSFLEPIQTFKLRKDLPSELFELDILDGSPPCSSFSMAGNREKDWGKQKKFREGQAKQELDTLFFDFIDLAKTLQPKVVIAENVKGLLLGNAKAYVRRIYSELEAAGYYVQHFLLDASTMGVPQRRERVFFIALRKDLATPFLHVVDMFNTQPTLTLEFNELPIPYKTIKNDNPIINCVKTEKVYPSWAKWVSQCEPGKDFGSIKSIEKSAMFNCCKVDNEAVIPTITAKFDGAAYFNDDNRHLNLHELALAQSYPLDYNYCGIPGQYIIGMSVPPVATAQIAHQIYLQWLSKI
jgi:DNA (cytosine-5)-methyltransferase 1